jgi:hypothetical protein
VARTVSAPVTLSAAFALSFQCSNVVASPTSMN